MRATTRFGILMAALLSWPGAAAAQTEEIVTPTLNPGLQAVGDYIINGLNQMTADARDMEQFYKNALKYYEALAKQRGAVQKWRDERTAAEKDLDERIARLQDAKRAAQGKDKDEVARVTRREKELLQAKKQLGSAAGSIDKMEGFLQICQKTLQEGINDPTGWNAKKNGYKFKFQKSLESLKKHTAAFTKQFGQATKTIGQSDQPEGNPEKYGTFTGRVQKLQGKDVEFYIDDVLMTEGKPFQLDKDGRFRVRVVALGARRKQSRDLKAKKSKALEGDATDHDFAYAAGDNHSRWTVTDESYEWQVGTRTNKPLGQTFKASMAQLKKDVGEFTVASDTGSETISFDVSGTVKWEMTGTRANGQKATDSADESGTSSMVVIVSPR